MTAVPRDVTLSTAAPGSPRRGPACIAKGYRGVTRAPTREEGNFRAPFGGGAPPIGGPPRSDEAGAQGLGHDLGAGARVEERADLLQPVLHGVRAAVHDARDLLVGEPARQVPHDRHVDLGP